MGSQLEPDRSYVLGVDGLPLGTQAAAASGGDVLAMFAVVDGAGGALPLEQRVQEALDRAGELMGALPSEVRLVCLDDGADGSDLARLADRLDGAGGIALRLVDAPPPPVADQGTDTADRRSAWRARYAALW
jgi:hypothetical protein